MLRWALTSLAMAINAGALGFTGIAAEAATVAKFLFGVFLLMFVLILLFKVALKELIRFNI